ncbi:MAG TPA: hypothetical protein VI248_00160 [Kineosporiaceae bacterium]
MSSSLPVGELTVALTERAFPTITMWNRLEGRPRTPDFTGALRAEVRDALWMLCKQWQMGEFRGGDAGSPAFATVQLQATPLVEYQPGTHAVRPFEADIPIETKVEQLALPMVRSGRPIALDLRLAMGRQWLTLTKGIGSYRAAFIAAYPIREPDPAARADADVCAHPEEWQAFAAVAGRAMDGASLYAYLTADPAHHAYDGIVGVSGADQAALDDRAAVFVAWFRRQFAQPTADEDAWDPARWEYSFAAAAPAPGGGTGAGTGTELVYEADAYHQGRLDWYSLDLAQATSLPLPGPATGGTPAPVATAPAPTVATTIPVPVTFAGMPNTRWWAFEDHATDFGDVDAATTDLAKLLYLEFALVYSNDWFVIPQHIPSAAVALIDGLAVTDVFGRRYLVEQAGHTPADHGGRWRMFELGGDVPQAGLPLLPISAKVQDGPDLEEVWLVRDEVANMVWGVEKTVPTATNCPKAGQEAARELRDYLQTLVAPTPVPPAPVPSATATPPRYQVMTEVPENWIPFLPVHVPGSNRAIQLQRAALPRILEGDPLPPVKVQPKTALLRVGLDAVPPRAYFVHEEEVPRAGVQLTRRYQRTRWTDGKVYTWLRVVRRTGRGEGSSGLAFDQLM